MRTLLAWAQLVRLPNVFTAWADIFLGGLVTGALFSQPTVFVCILTATTCFYWAGMVWNDYFDLEIDRKERPGRPLPSGRINVRTAMVFGIALILGGLAAAFTADVLQNGEQKISLLIAVVLVTAILGYDGGLKNTLMGPSAMGACRFLNILLGLSMAGTYPAGWGLLLATVVGLYIAGVTWFAYAEAEISDTTSLKGAACIIGFSLILALMVPGLAATLDGEVTTWIGFPYLLACFSFYVGMALWWAIERPEPLRVQRAIKRSILGLVILDAILASSLIGSAGLFLVVLLLPGMVLGRWVYST